MKTDFIYQKTGYIIMMYLILICFSCSKENDPCQAWPWYQDGDGDGYGNPSVATSACDQPAGYVSSNKDCDDSDRFINPGMAEISGDDIDNNCDGNSLLSLGDYYQGGLIFYLDQNGQHGLISSVIDQGSDVYWCNDTLGCYIANTRKEVGYGWQNTNYIIEGLGESNYAAWLCVDSKNGGYEDWFLPSLDELILMRQNLHFNGLGNFSEATYWTSTGLDDWNMEAYLVHFDNKNDYYGAPTYGRSYVHVRAIRKF